MKRTRTIFPFLLLVWLASCKRQGQPAPGPLPPLPPGPPVETTAPTIGFFLQDWQPLPFTVPIAKDTTTTASAQTLTLTIDPLQVITRIPRTLFGNNANPYMTQMVTEPLLLEHIRNLLPGYIRFPGGNLSSIYFWDRARGQSPADAPARLLDANGRSIDAGYWFGKNEEGWTLSVDNYYRMLQQTGSQGIITVNYGYARYGTSADPVAAAAHHAANWVRYDNGRTRYWEVGNESNGTWQAGYRIDARNNKDGQPEFITGDLYGQHFKVFADSMKKAAAETGRTIYIGAQLLEKEAPAWATPTDKGWNAGVFSKAGSTPDFYIVHSYYTNFGENTAAGPILQSAIEGTARMMQFLQASASRSGATLKPVALTEWNIFAEGSMQQVSHISGLHAALVFGELLRNKFGFAARWDLANGWSGGNDHGLFNNGDEPGAPKWNPRPAFFHQYYFQKVTGDRLVSATFDGSAEVSAYASTFSGGGTGLVLVNRGNSQQTVRVQIKNNPPGGRYYWYALTGGGDNGEFSRKVLVNGQGPTGPSGGPAHYASLPAYAAPSASGIRVVVPARAAVYMMVEK